MLWTYIDLLGGGYVLPSEYIETVVTTSRKQQVMIVNHPVHGRTLYINGEHQSTQADEWIYHECLVHPAVALCANTPRHALILGGGEGCVARELLRWPTIEQVTMIDWDAEVVALCATDLGWDEGAFEHAGLTLIEDDALDGVRRLPSIPYIDVAIIDLPTPDEGADFGHCPGYAEPLLLAVRDRLSPGAAIGVHLGPVHSAHVAPFQAAQRAIQRVWPQLQVFFNPELRWAFGVVPGDDRSLRAFDEFFFPRPLPPGLRYLTNDLLFHSLSSPLPAYLQQKEQIAHAT